MPEQIALGRLRHFSMGAQVDRTADIIDVATRILEAHGATLGNGMRLKELIPAIRASIGPEPSDSHIYWTILDSSKKGNSRIRSGGPWKGYYLVSTEQADQDLRTLEQETEEAEVEPPKQKERDLYPVVAAWLKTKKGINCSKDDIYNKKAGGKWGNPDVFGVRVIDDLGFFDIDIVSCEVKISKDNWRHYIFEAVSHKRFSNRVYYIFSSDAEDLADEDVELYAYAEKYQIGIAVIALTPEGYAKLPSWNSLSEAEKLDYVDSVKEKVPAPYELVSVDQKIEVLRRIGVNSRKDIYLIF
ncbi:hypothetical protein [Prosthecomicrobium pneumaticum]|uniref:HTH HARE-type domain-containing protein n=1 Tax=Prosthecomicrobium pneumaticum TaxID=81895 RepID=A0A7W9FMT5_9HYPH|nr:hypothetical protein [Prosthecomicrobium pneumaticum]MBB5753595.1 hypothetical protein [Prosthecomicrobium pneumaticum]